MKKSILILFTAFIFSSCGGSPELSPDFFADNLDIKKLELNLSDKDFTQVPNFSKYMTESMLHYVYSIDLSKNDIQTIPAGAFDIFPNLNTINLSSNDFRFGSDIKLPKTTRTLILSDNGLENLDGFHEYENIAFLDLVNNGLEDEDLSKLRELGKLRNIQLDGNNLSIDILAKIDEFNIAKANMKQRVK